MRTKSRPLAGAALSLSALLALAACGNDAATDTDTAAAEGAETVSFTWDRNTAAGDEEPQLEETTVEVPVDPEDIVVFDMASLDTSGALGGEVSGAPLDSVPEYLQDNLAEDAYDVGSADRIVAMRNGVVVADAPAREVMRPDVLAAVYDTPVDVREIDGTPVALYYG